MEENLKSNHAQKMKMRNLRAKVRLLLPNNVCRHYQDRNCRIEKLQPKMEKHIQTIKQECLKGCWKKSVGNMQTWYHEKDQASNTFAQFYKLSKEQLSEISDNKHYFLTQKYVEPFMEFYQKQSRKPSLENIPPMKKKKRRYCQSSSIPSVIPNQVITNRHIQKQTHRQRAAIQRFHLLQDIRKSKSLQKQGLIQSKILKAVNIKDSINRQKSQTNRLNNTKRTLNIKNIQQLQNMRSQKTDIIRMTGELKRVCTFRPKKNYFEKYQLTDIYTSLGS